MSNFVIHDDNFGPYFCLPRHFLKKDSFRILYGLQPIRTASRSTEAEAVGFNFCGAIANAYTKRHQEWYDRFALFARGEWLVLRTMLLKRADYLAELDTLRDRAGMQLETDLRVRLGDVLPAQFWMVEASAPELFAATRRKFGEILVAADKPPAPLTASLLIGARLPGLVVINPGTGSLEVLPTQMLGHTPLFTFGIAPQPQ